ncbi:hypothetical protein VIBNISOn1_1390037 [Vibrio nigripulchritudo SOn1]|uniref:Uncharacterized protein n=2 Tax=Vibrio nigripulchritudo TaxID=28173 RepID=A0AAV2VKC1_9VIBR|nr:hypothetical protein VIBNISOn1_1390037 [Vibrio nigripulchritudo SOn1]
MDVPRWQYLTETDACHVVSCHPSIRTENNLNNISRPSAHLSLSGNVLTLYVRKTFTCIPLSPTSNTTKLMKYLYFIASLLVIALFSASVTAHKGYVTGEIDYLRIHDIKVKPEIDNVPIPIFLLTLKGVTNAGVCTKVNNGNILFAMELEENYRVAMNALMEKKRVSIRYNDTTLTLDGYCLAYDVSTDYLPVFN